MTNQQPASSNQQLAARHLIVSQHGAFIGKHSQRLRVKVQKEIVAEVPLIHVDHVLVAARGVSISSDAVRLCTEAGVPITFVAWNGRPYARLVSAGLVGTVQTRRQQLLAYTDERGRHLACAFARGKLGNQANLLKRLAKYRKGTDPALYREMRQAAVKTKALADEVSQVEAATVDEARPTLLNLEGRGASIYWSAVKRLLPADLDWPGREGRGATDLVNSLLNYGYGILYTQVEHAAMLAGLDPYAGFLHVDRPGKPSLVLDLIEEFRQPVVDRAVLALLNRRVALSLDDAGRLDETTRRTLAGRVLTRLDEGREPYERKKHTLRTILQRQARHVATYVRGKGSYKPFIATW